VPTWEQTTEIEASPARVWEVMADVGRWPQWTASIVSLEPPAAGMGPGAKAQVQAKGTPKSEYVVTEWQPGAGFTWETKVRGVRSIARHSIEGVEEGRSRVRLSVEVVGLLATLLKPLIGKSITPNLVLEAEGLKRESESVAVPV
jgi:hypothetical protein